MNASDLHPQSVSPPFSERDSAGDAGPELSETDAHVPDSSVPRDTSSPPDISGSDFGVGRDTQMPDISNLEQCIQTCDIADAALDVCFGGNTVGGRAHRDPHALFPAKRSLAFFIAAASAPELEALGLELSARVTRSSDERVMVIDGAPRQQIRERASEISGLGAELPTLVTVAGRRIVATDRLVVRFTPGAQDMHTALEDAGVRAVRTLGFGANGFIAELARAGDDVFEAAATLTARADVAYAAPDFLRSYVHRTNDPDFAQQWHLEANAGNSVWPGADIQALEAWEITTGALTSIIAINDDGVDHAHPDLQAHIVPGYKVPDVASLDRRFNNGCCVHGTSVAGVAAAIGDNAEGGLGVCPDCGIMPIFTGFDFADDSVIAESFTWPADQGAAVVNNSWGPPDGDPTILDDPPDDPLAEPLSPVVENAIQYAFKQGRDGKGTLLVFAAGNGNESTASDPFVSHPLTLGVAAISDFGRKSWYSDFGASVHVAAPSDGGLTPGIYTTDIRQWYGYNSGDPRDGDRAGNYTNAFGGTSSAAPVVSGVIGLMVAANPNLSATEIRDILQATADPIDALNAGYDASGQSTFYGTGRVNAYRAVRAAVGSENCVPFASERCNGVDDTCDGQIDEGCPTLTACSPCSFDAACGPNAVCAQTPGDESPHCLSRCDSSGTCASGYTCDRALCVPPSGRCAACEASERCNGVDDNCDGQIDESGCQQKRFGDLCDFDAECPGGGRCIGELCQRSCSSSAQCGDWEVCSAHTALYGDVDPSFKVCGYAEPTCADLNCDPQWNDNQRQYFMDCIARAGDNCDDIYACVWGF